MTAQNFSTVAQHVVGQYNEAGKTLVGAYRAGAHRLLNGVATRYDALLGGRQLPLLNDGIKTRLVGAQQKVNGFLTQRLDIDTGRVVAAMDRVATGTASGIASAAQRASRVESPIGSSMLGTLNSIHMPIATLSAQIADRVVAGAKRIETRVAGAASVEAKPRTTPMEAKAKAKAAVKPVVRRALRSTRTARKAA